MNKFKIGDTVIIRKDLYCGRINGLHCNEIMLTYQGMKTEIVSIEEFSHYYRLKIDRKWAWNDSMIESGTRNIKPFKIVEFLNSLNK
jgi:hypothetical protein